MLAIDSLDWSKIDTVLLDMDGTLLDLHFDSFFWLQHLPVRYAQIHRQDLAESRAYLLLELAKNRGTIDWYCTDFWSEKFNLDIASLRAEVAHNIAYRPYVEEFLKLLKRSGKRVVLVTNDHRSGLALKLAATGLGKYLDNIVVSHDYSVAKEQQAFWQQMQADEAFDPQKSLFIDDTVAVLDSAKKYGIAHLRYIVQPNSQLTREHCDKHLAIDCFSQFNRALIPLTSQKEQL
ncbi:MAG: hypothetical protein OFPII_20720 [Osedax symbiont Rs1]|nr:MAG: hypothetical protein OFPII_20720 [Osedax symbiont Rs1]